MALMAFPKLRGSIWQALNCSKLPTKHRILAYNCLNLNKLEEIGVRKKGGTLSTTIIHTLTWITHVTNSRPDIR